MNVCLTRWKSGGQIITPASFCPRCKESISWYDNIPIISFFVLGGKCRHCEKAISLQYPVVETMTAFLFFLSSCCFLKESLFLLITSFFFVSFLVLLSTCDFQWRLLPHLFNNLFILAGLFINVFRFPLLPSVIFTTISGFIIMGSIIFGLFLFFSNGLGGGDIKMVAGLALWMGLLNATYVLIFACVTASFFFFLKAIKRKRVQWKELIPFGPYLAIGALLFWFFPGLEGDFLKWVH